MPVLNNILYGLLNTHTGEAQTFSKVTTWIDGSAMDDSKCDGTIFRKKDADYFKLNYTGPVNIKWFGAKGDGTTDDTPAFQRFIDAFAGVGETALLEHGTFLLKDLVVPTGYRFLSNQKPANNSHAAVNATIRPATGATYIFIFPATTRYSVLENLNIDGDHENFPNLLAAVSFTGAYNKLLGNNINACAQSCVIMPEATTCTIKDNFMGGWFGPAPVFENANDFRGTLQIEICGDSYIVDNEFSASIPYFTSYPDPTDVLRDKTHGRICAMAIRTYFGNSVCTGNIFENGDRAVVLAGCVYSYFGGNRYELSGMGNLYIRGSMYNTSFCGERFADGSLAGDGVYDDIELATGAVGNVSFMSPVFLILSNSVVPASSFKVRYNLTNYASLEIAWIEPVYDANYVSEGYVNPNLPAFPVRTVTGQYYPQDPVFKSSLTIGKRLPNDSVDTDTKGYVRIDTGTSAANQNRTGIVGWYKANDLRVSAIGFDNADNAMSFALTNPGVYSFSNGGLFTAKAGGTFLNLQSNDGEGACAINFYSDPAQTKVGLISMNSDTGQFNIVSSGQMLYQSPGFTFIGGDITAAKAGGVSMGLLCSDGTGSSMFRISSDPLAAHEFRISMNNATGVTRLTSGDDIIIGGTGGGNVRFQQNGLTFIPETPTPGSVADAYLLGRNTSTGEQVIIDPATLKQGTLTSVALSLPSSVFSVSGSPITANGTLSGILVTQTANTLFAGPTTGVAAAPTFRTLVAADVPALDTAKITTGTLPIARGGTGLAALGTANQLIRVNTSASALEYFTPAFLTGNQTITLSGDIAGSGSTAITATIADNAVTYAKMQDVTSTRLLGRYAATNGDPQEVTIGTGLTLNSTTGTLTATGTGGTVTSVALSVPSILAVTGSPITTTGTLAVTLATQTANTLFAGPTTGVAAAPTFRTLVAADVPALDTAKITTGTLPIARGGTGLAALGTANQLIRVNAGASTLEYFTPAFLTGNQTITLSGDIAGSGTTAITATLPNIATAGTYNSVTVNAKGQVTAGSNISNVPSSRGMTITAGTGISITGGTQDLTADRAWTITNTGAPDSGSANYIQNTTTPQASSNFNVSGTGGIGVTNVTAGFKLDVGGSVRSTGNFTSTSGSVTSALTYSGSTAGVVGSFSNHPFAIYVNSAEKMRIQANGFVGIGTTSPTALLEVNGDTILRGSVSISGTVSSSLSISIPIKFTSGTPGTGKVWTSDASGNGSWQTPATPSNAVLLSPTSPGTAQTGHININGTATVSTGMTVGALISNGSAELRTTTNTGAALQLNNTSTGYVNFYTGNGSPEGVVYGKRGSVYLRQDGGLSATLYVKETDSAGLPTTTGWMAK